jgi:hypothetical protein
MRLVLYDVDGDDENRPDDLIVVGTAEWDSDEIRWVCRVNWEDADHASVPKSRMSGNEAVARCGVAKLSQLCATT